MLANRFSHLAPKGAWADFGMARAINISLLTERKRGATYQQNPIERD